jgi:acyl-CoA synthetase (AMP-forming)/AMP-acid ligase II
MTDSSYKGIYELLQKQVDLNPDKCGVVIDRTTFTFWAIAKRAEQTAQYLHGLGVRQGDRVGLILPTSENWIYAFWGIMKLGAIVVPLAPGTGKAELINLFKLVEVKVCLTLSRFQATELALLLKAARADLPSLTNIVVVNPGETDDFARDFADMFSPDVSWQAENEPSLAPDDYFALMSTSGSTGLPKVIPKRHGNFVEYLTRYLEEFVLDGGETFFSTMPPFHALGMSYLAICMLRGVTMAFLSVFDPEEALALIPRNKVTKMLLSATNAKMMMASPDFENTDLASVGTFMFSGEYCPDEVAAEFHEKRDFKVMNIMGSTEGNAYLEWHSDRDKGFSVSVFTPSSQVELKLMHENGDDCQIGERGEIFISHCDLLPEYYKNPEATAQTVIKSETGKTWLVTGDMAVPLPGGRYQYAGRKKRVIKRGGTLIYPEEIEAFLLGHPEIQGAAIVKEADDVKGEAMRAFVELKKGSTLEVIDIISYCQAELSNAKIPDKIEIIDEIPRETGKAQLKKLRQL